MHTGIRDGVMLRSQLRWKWHIVAAMSAIVSLIVFGGLYLINGTAPIPKWWYMFRWKTVPGKRPQRPVGLDGRWTDWDADGNVERDGMYRHGVLWEGTVTESFGGHTFIMVYKNGQPWEGRFPRGGGADFRFVETYHEGRRVPGQSDMLWRKNPGFTTKRFEYMTAGTKRGSFGYRMGKQHGIWTEWDVVGQVLSNRFYWEDERVSEAEYHRFLEAETAARRERDEADGRRSGALRVRDGYVVLVKRGTTYGAFVLEEQTETPEAATYRWYYRRDGGGDLDEEGDNVAAGTRKGSRIAFGPFEIEWSVARDGEGWVYCYASLGPPRSERGVQICVTGRTSIEGVHAASSEWQYVGVAERDKDDL